MQHNPRLLWFDFIRATCAILVCAGHLRSVAFIDYAELSNPTFFEKVFYFATGLGHQAVMVFFVMSGFFVGGSVLRSGKSFSFPKYLIARLSRLWTVLVPALVFTTGIDWLLSVVAPEVLNGTYGPVWHSGPGESAAYAAGPGVLAGNLLFLQGIAVPVYGTDGPLWSLANEFWYYILFPLGFIAVRGIHQEKEIPVWLRVVIASLGLLLIRWLPSGHVAGFLVWMLGLLVFQTQGSTGSRTRQAMLWIGLFVAVASLVYSKLESLQSDWQLSPDLAVGFAFTLLLIGLSCGRAPSTSLIPLRGPIEGLSNSSFSLYLFHFPLVVLIGTFYYKGQPVAPTIPELSVFALWLLFLIGVGYGFYLLFERHTESVRRVANGLIGLAPSPR
jgi:peptidoglycan/LPS O-acetylase OafA/YrhL